MTYSFVLIGCCDYFGFGFTALNRNARQKRIDGVDQKTDLQPIHPGYVKQRNSLRTELRSQRSMYEMTATIMVPGKIRLV